MYAQLNHYRIKFLNQFYGHIKVSIYIYTILRYALKKSPISHATLLKFLTLLLSPLIFITIWFLKITKKLVSCWIACTDTNYVSMLDGTETIFIGQESKENKAIITTLFLLEDIHGPELSGDEFHNYCVENITRIFQKPKFLKLQCSVQYKLGYFYFKKEDFPVESYFRTLEAPNIDRNMNQVDGSTKCLQVSTLTMEQLREIVSEVSNEQMPNNGTSFWEARVGKRKLEGSNCYPFILRIHHIFGDAITLFNMFSVDFQQNHKATTKQHIESKVRGLDATYTQNPFITMSGLVDPPDSNVLCQANGNKHIVWLTEETPEILDTIKEIKQRQKSLKNEITVVDVMLTCFTESLTSHFEKLNVDLPTEVYTVLPMISPNVKYTPYGRVTNYDISNKISLGFLRLPLKIKEVAKGASLTKRLELIKYEYNVFKNHSLDFWCNRWQGTVILTLLPWFMQKWLILKYGISLMVSNIPGCDSLEFFGRLKVKEFVFIDPNTSISGVTLMITSYEKRLNFAYTIDKAVIPKVEDVKNISKDFLLNLQKLKEVPA